MSDGWFGFTTVPRAEATSLEAIDYHCFRCIPLEATSSLPEKMADLPCHQECSLYS